MTETLAYLYSSESTQGALSNEYQHDRASMVFKNICIRALWATVASVLEGLRACCDGNSVIEAPPLTFPYLSPLHGFESRLGYVRKLPVTWGYAMVATGYPDFLHPQLSKHAVA